MPDPHMASQSPPSSPLESYQTTSLPRRSSGPHFVPHTPVVVENEPNSAETAQDQLITKPSGNRYPKNSSTTSFHRSSATESYNGPIKALWLRLFTLRVWSYELLCATFAILSFAAIVAVVYFYDGKSFPDFPYGLSINAIIAVFTAVIKASIGLVAAEGISHLKWIALEKPQRMSTFDAYDQASHGPLGAAMLLGRYGWKLKHGVPAIGALVLILLLPMDPLAQQLVQFYSCQSPEPGTSATLPRAQIVDGGIESLSYNMGLLRYNTSMVSHANFSDTIIAAVGQALFGTEQALPFGNCVTSNCSFHDEYSSIGFCNMCLDVSEQLIKQDLQEDVYGTDGEVVALRLTSIYSLPLGSQSFNYNESQNVSVSSTKLLHLDTMEYDTKYANYSPFGPYAFTTRQQYNWEYDFGIPTTNLSMITILSEAPGQMNRSISASADVEALTCSITPCISTYQYSEMQEYSIKDELESFIQTEWGYATDWYSRAYGDVFWHGSYYAVADLECLADREHQRAVLHALGYSFEDSARWLPYNVSFQHNDRNAMHGEYFSSPRLLQNIPPSARIFYKKWDRPSFDTDLDDLDDLSWHDWADRLLFLDSNEYYMLNKTAREIIPKECIYQYAQAVNTKLLMALGAFFAGNQLQGTPLESLLYSPDGKSTRLEFEGKVGQIAETLTRYIRSKAREQFNPPARGKVLENTVCIEVRWSWMTYLVGMIIATLMFFIAMLATSRSAQARMAKKWSAGQGSKVSFHDFKSSSLPLLLCGLDKNLVDQSERASNAGMMVSTEELEEIAKELRISLEPTEKGWKVSLVEPESSGLESEAPTATISAEVIHLEHVQKHA